MHRTQISPSQPGGAKTSYDYIKQLDRSLLPDPIQFYAELGLTLTKGSGPWRSALCPFHGDTRPSLRIHLEFGGFRCMSCGAKGRDVIAFLMKLQNLNFIQAVSALGAWR